MHPYINRLKEEMDRNPPCYGYKAANSLLEMLYMWYVEWNPINSDEIQKDFFALEPYWGCCTDRQKDDVFDIVSRLCQQHEQLAFLEGIRVGYRLANEL